MEKINKARSEEQESYKGEENGKVLEKKIMK